MNNLGDYLDKKAQKLDLSRADELIRVQALLENKYPNKAHATKIKNKTLYIKTMSSSVATELRFDKARYLSDQIEKIVIRS